MKNKLITIESEFLAACGKSEEEKKKEEAQAQLVAKQIERNQKKAAMEALDELIALKGSTALYYSEHLACSDDILKAANANSHHTEMVDNISILPLPNGCELKATFKELTLIPDLSKESMILTMTVINCTFTWKCRFTGKNKRDIPEICQ